MTEQKSGDTIHVKIGGNASGPVVAGNRNTVIQTIGATKPGVTEAELAELHQLLADLKAQVEAEAPLEKRDAALERLDELAKAVNAPEPKLSTIEYVRDWFAENLPKLAEAVTDVIRHPAVGAVMLATGEVLAAEFRRRFGLPN